MAKKKPKSGGGAAVTEPTATAAETVTAEVKKRFRNRNKTELTVPAASIRINPKNWRTHPEYQTTAMTNVLEEIGFVGKLLCWEPEPGVYELLDGHLRRDLLGTDEVEIVVTDLNRQEADLLLATFDAITGLAVPDQDRLSSLLRDLQGMDVPLVEFGWPEYRLEQVLAEEYRPPASTATTDALAAAAAGGETTGGDATGDATAPVTSDGFKQFTVPLTVAQELRVRDIIKAAKKKFGVESSGDAVAKILEEWAVGQDSPKADGG